MKHEPPEGFDAPGGGEDPLRDEIEWRFCKTWLQLRNIAESMFARAHVVYSMAETKRSLRGVVNRHRPFTVLKALSDGPFETLDMSEPGDRPAKVWLFHVRPGEKTSDNPVAQLAARWVKEML